MSIYQLLRVYGSIVFQACQCNKCGYLHSQQSSRRFGGLLKCRVSAKDTHAKLK